MFTFKNIPNRIEFQFIFIFRIDVLFPYQIYFTHCIDGTERLYFLLLFFFLCSLYVWLVYCFFFRRSLQVTNRSKEHFLWFVSWHIALECFLPSNCSINTIIFGLISMKNKPLILCSLLGLASSLCIWHKFGKNPRKIIMLSL